LDAPTGELILRIGADAEGRLHVTFHLYDSKGHPTAESEDTSGSNGICVHAPDGELLLELPSVMGENIRYRLYNRNGQLLTSSDGVSTQIGPCLRMESLPRGVHHGSRQPRPV
jgi:hypothetical protein